MLALQPEVPRRTRAQARARTSHVARVAVAAVLAAPLTLGLVIGPHVMAHYGSDGPEVVRHVAVECAAAAYGRWAAAHPAGECPSSLGELAGYSQGRALVDPWAAQLVLVCHAGRATLVPVGLGDGP